MPRCVVLFDVRPATFSARILPCEPTRLPDLGMGVPINGSPDEMPSRESVSSPVSELACGTADK